jgi:hypothetical protein
MAQLLTPLQTHLRNGMATDFDRASGADCAMFVCDWILIATGIDPAGHMRGAYVSGAGALRLITRWGGYDVMWSVHMAIAGFNLTKSPQDGDVGVVIDAAGNMISAISCGGLWHAKTERGIIGENFRTVLAWSLKRG